ncbi:MAG TPA: protein-glutamate O-methyltransferase CheR [Methylophilaceae bacterium]|nr:protein-glutamate O-methyltransferase CheR [Methylophilaceae bacterium]
MEFNPITLDEFHLFKRFIYDQAGINLSDNKQSLVSGRLAKRLRLHGLQNFGDYYRLINSHSQAAEAQVAVDLLTTNETHFFREPKHFDFLRSTVLPKQAPGRLIRVWSAASSTGEEPYTIAMLLADQLKDNPWEVIGSDLSTRVLEKARHARYAIDSAAEIPRHYLTRYCLKGTGNSEGVLLIARELRSRVQFMQVNLMQPFPALGEFDIIFLRNVMIYFDNETKRQLVTRMLPLLKPGGYFIISHSESLNGISDAYELVSPSIYRKPEASA